MCSYLTLFRSILSVIYHLFGKKELPDKPRLLIVITGLQTAARRCVEIVLLLYEIIVKFMVLKLIINDGDVVLVAKALIVLR
jgi:hypothetical protein